MFELIKVYKYIKYITSSNDQQLHPRKKISTKSKSEKRKITHKSNFSLYIYYQNDCVSCSNGENISTRDDSRAIGFDLVLDPVYNPKTFQGVSVNRSLFFSL